MLSTTEEPSQWSFLAPGEVSHPLRLWLQILCLARMSVWLIPTPCSRCAMDSLFQIDSGMYASIQVYMHRVSYACTESGMHAPTQVCMHRLRYFCALPIFPCTWTRCRAFFKSARMRAPFKTFFKSLADGDSRLGQSTVSQPGESGFKPSHSRVALWVWVPVTAGLHCECEWVMLLFLQGGPKPTYI